ncbi:ABC transporter family substrate-binding protein [Planosporangium sp. 12N6]|uniref:ABC transporter family substrate-binding protein n=1 Tax=Planosporangium spinosum TaxID=3402278 RepID=UPI003CFB2FF8
MKRRVVLATIVALSVSGVAACGGGGSGAKTQPQAKAGVNDIAATPRDQVKDGGQLVWPLAGMPPNFNYNQVDGVLKDNSDVMNALLPLLYLTDAAANPIWNKDYLAEEAKLQTDPKQVVTVTLNPKATWSDGTPITWEDLQWQWKANSGADPAYLISSSNGWKEIESVTKGKDDRQAVITFKNKYADWQSLLNNPLYPKSTNSDPKVFNEGWVEKIPVTAGPFRFEALDKTAKTLTIARDDKWWGNKAKLDKIVYKAVEDNARPDALANGEIDFMEIGANVNNFKRAKALADKVDLRRAGGPNFRHITINGSRPHLSDVNVRRALALAINRETIAKALLEPLEQEPKVLNNHIFMTNHSAYQDNAGELSKANPEKARQLLDAAGWKLDGGVRKKDGKPLEINFVIPANVQASKQESELIQAMLKEVGVTVTIKTVPVAELFDKNLRPGNFDMTVFSYIGTAFPTSSSESIYKKPVTGANGEVQVEQNYARIGTDEIDASFQKTNSELDKAKNQELANKTDALIWDEVHSLTLYQRPDLWAVKKGLVNFGAFAYASAIYEDLGYTK